LLDGCNEVGLRSRALRVVSPFPQDVRPFHADCSGYLRLGSTIVYIIRVHDNGIWATTLRPLAALAPIRALVELVQRPCRVTNANDLDASVRDLSDVLQLKCSSTALRNRARRLLVDLLAAPSSFDVRFLSAKSRPRKKSTPSSCIVCGGRVGRALWDGAWREELLTLQAGGAGMMLVGVADAASARFSLGLEGMRSVEVVVVRSMDDHPWPDRVIWAVEMPCRWHYFVVAGPEAAHEWCCALSALKGVDGSHAIRRPLARRELAVQTSAWGRQRLVLNARCIRWAAPPPPPMPPWELSAVLLQEIQSYDGQAPPVSFMDAVSVSPTVTVSRPLTLTSSTLHPLPRRSTAFRCRT